MNKETLPQYIKIKDAAIMLGIHPNTLRNWERDGKVKSVRIGARKDRRFLKTSLMELVQ